MFLNLTWIHTFHYWERFLRWAFFKWWRLFAALVVGNYIPGGILILLQKGWKELFSYLTSWGLIASFERDQPVLFGVLLTIVVLLTPASLLAERRHQAERVERERQRGHQSDKVHHLTDAALDVVRTAIDDHLIRFNLADNAPAESLGPPLDDTFLPLPLHFVNRSNDLKWLKERLNGGGTTGITTIGGLAGIGKTALAAMAVHQLREEGRFRDGIAVIFCRELTNATDILKRVLTRFDPERRRPETDDLAALTELAHKLLSGKDALVILDNVEPELALEKVVAPLGAAGATLLLTTRQTLPDDIVPVQASYILDLLSPEEALNLFVRSFGRGAEVKLSARDRAAAEHIIAALQFHTLAVKLAGAYAANAHRALEELARGLEENPQRAIEVPGGAAPRSVALVFAESTERLPPDAQRLFAALAAFRSVEFSRRSTLALAAALDLANPQGCVDSLVLWALVDATTSRRMPEGSDRERLRMHLLLHTFAASRFNQWTEEERFTAHHAIANYYSVYANKTPSEALGADETNINGALEWAHGHEEHELVVALCSGMKIFWNESNRVTESLRYLPWGISAAEAIVKTSNEPVNRLRVADLTLAYGQVHRPCGNVDEVEQIFKANLAIRREVQDRRGEGVVLANLGQSARRRGRLQEAEDYFHKALTIAREVQNRREYAVILISLGQVARDQGQVKEAEDYYQQALIIANEVQDRRVESAVRVSLGQLSQFYRRIDEAERYFQEALAMAHDVQDQSGEGIAFSRLGELARGRGQLEEAERYYERGLALHREMQGRRDEGVVLGLLGQLATDRGHLEEAKNYYEQSLAIRREVQDRRGEGVILAALGQLAQDHKQLQEAEQYYRQGIDILRGQDAINYAAVALAFGTFLIELQSKHDEGCAMLTEAAQLYARMGLPNEKEARETMQGLGCKERGQEFSWIF